MQVFVNLVHNFTLRARQTLRLHLFLYAVITSDDLSLYVVPAAVVHQPLGSTTTGELLDGDVAKSAVSFFQSIYSRRERTSLRLVDAA